MKTSFRKKTSIIDILFVTVSNWLTVLFINHQKIRWEHDNVHKGCSLSILTLIFLNEWQTGFYWAPVIFDHLILHHHWQFSETLSKKTKKIHQPSCCRGKSKIACSCLPLSFFLTQLINHNQSTFHSSNVLIVYVTVLLKHVSVCCSFLFSQKSCFLNHKLLWFDEQLFNMLNKASNMVNNGKQIN